MAQAGWYPDPGGQSGLYRYWDGKAWSAGLSPNPSAPPPAQGLGSSGTQQPQQPQYGQQSGQYGAGQPQAEYLNYQQGTPKKRSFVGWWIGIAAVVVVLALVIVFVVRGVTGGGSGAGPSGNGSEEACPSVSSASQSAGGQTTNDGRVHGGPLSYPELGAPWSPPSQENRVAFGADVLSQTITIEPNYDKLSSWVASVLVGRLIAGDGFYSPEQGSQIVTKCIVGSFYGDAQVTRTDKVNKATKVDGHSAWIVESHLSFDIKNLKTKGETMIVVIVNAGDTSGLYYASIPDTSPQYLQPARDALEGLTVD